ncbi:MAG: DNA primase small subunit PriS [Candidatus Bathyarchaeia archaeon]
MSEPNNISFIREMFSDFYSKNADKIEPPKSIENREFGFSLFKENVMVRHKSFARIEDLRDFIKKNVPSNVYYSSAYYSFPEAKMDEKGWLGSDLFFDIDADHIPTKCNKMHDSWACKSCNFEGRGKAPEKCPNCGGESFDERTWPCEVCLEAARVETIKLIDILLEDFGLSADEIKCSFSGHRGYHVGVESDIVLELDALSRKEIVDYITGTGIDAVFHGLDEIRSGSSKIIVGPSLDDPGWRGRAARGTYDFLLRASASELKSLGIKKNVVMELVEKRDAILESWRRGGPWNTVRGLGIKGWGKIIQRGVSLQSANIDTVVTVDIHRLIRLPGTLHGKTGLLKISFPVSRVEEFDPQKEAIAFKAGEVKIYVEEAPELRFGDEIFGPFKSQVVTLPTQVAIFLLCKGAARVVD